MLRSLVVVLAGGVLAGAAILPEEFGRYRRGSPVEVAIENRPVWDEYGFESAEAAEYTGSGQKFTLTAYRFKDPTGAFGAFQWQRPANAQSGLTAAGTADGSLVSYENYLLRFSGAKPHPASLEFLYGRLPNAVRSSLPTLYAHLPKKGRVANSERYFLGPAALSIFEPRVPASLAAFDRGAEAQLARYRIGGKELQLTIFSYPTPQMAIERTREFEKAGFAVRRSGPLVSVVPEAADGSGADKLLAEIAYKPSLTWNEWVPKDTPQDAAKMILAISMLAAGLIVASVLLGIVFGGSKSVLRKLGMTGAGDELTTLGLTEK